MSKSTTGWQQDIEEVPAIFTCNHRGEARIAFSDPVYAQADIVLLEPKSRAIHVIVHENAYLISHAPDSVIRAFENNGKVLLTATRPDGRVLEFTAPVSIRRQSEETGQY